MYLIFIVLLYLGKKGPQIFTSIFWIAGRNFLWWILIPYLWSVGCTRRLLAVGGGSKCLLSICTGSFECSSGTWRSPDHQWKGCRRWCCPVCNTTQRFPTFPCHGSTKWRDITVNYLCILSFIYLLNVCRYILSSVFIISLWNLICAVPFT